jgi:hypothetical protein
MFDHQYSAANAEAFRVGLAARAQGSVGAQILMDLDQPGARRVEIPYELAVSAPRLAPRLRLLEVGVPDKICTERTPGNHAGILALVEQTAEFRGRQAFRLG